MSGPGSPQEAQRLSVGLCFDCCHSRQVTSGKGSVFFYCLRSEIDATYPKYPRLPVVECAGYERQKESPSR